MGYIPGLTEKIYRYLYRHRVAILGLLAATLALTWPVFLSSGKFPAGIDTPAHLFKIDMIQTMMQEHGKLIHWTDKWYAGYPFLSLYAPLSFYLAYGLNVVVQDIMVSFNVMRVLLLYLTGFITYLIVDRESETKYASLGAGLLVVSSYPVYNNLFTIGRIAFAMGIVLYLISIYLLTDERIYTRDINRTHVYLAITLAALLLTHPMSAYLLAYTGIIIVLVYSDRFKNHFALRPFTFMALGVFVLAMPYIASFLQHSFILDPFWIQRKLSFNQFPHLLSRTFGDTLPQYMGVVHVGLFVAGLVGALYERSRFLTFSVLNFLLFFIFFWSIDLGLLHMIPMGEQFDLARFQALFTLYTAIIAGFGLKEVVSAVDNKKIILVLIVAVAAIDVAPMVSESSNWSPKFEGELSSIPIDKSHRTMTVGMRHWDDYIIPVEMDARSTMGWFQQADPHYNFTQTLQHTSGVWYPIDLNFPRRRNTTLRKNLMQLSNTKYIIFGKKWVPNESKEYVVGNYVPLHDKNRRLLNETKTDEEFSKVYDTPALEIHSLDREMGLCRAVNPVSIEENYYFEARDLLSKKKMFPKVPVKGEIKKAEVKNLSSISASCEKNRPYSINIDVSDPTWVLVSESYYPFWNRKNEAEIYDAFGFMVTYVNDSAELVYNPNRGGIRS